MVTEPALIRAVSAYENEYGIKPEMVIRAPGRVNLIGEHTDYNDGFVLPCAIDRDTVVAIGAADNGQINVVAADFGHATDHFDPATPIERTTDEWANYVRGVAKFLAAKGCALPAANMAIAGDVPLGSGLSSSASLEIAVGCALAEMAGYAIAPADLALLAQAAENQFVGCACGIMDQLISACGVDGHALLIDCRTLECTPVSLPSGVAVIIAHSGVRHAHAGGEYNDRRAQCEAAARHYGVAALRDLSLEALDAGRRDLDDVSFRRARHVVTENARTTAAAMALRSGDLAQLGALMAASHASMRDDFEITVPAVDRLAQIMAEPLNGNGGARMTGGGFGGCVVGVVPLDMVQTVTDAIAKHYRTPDGTMEGGKLADVFICKAATGASRIS
jgi:galactokinase